MRTFGICVESSHGKGMGHLFRAMCLVECIKAKNDGYVLIVNDDKRSAAVLKKRGIMFEAADLSDFTSGWEAALIRKHKIDVWVNDRLDTDARHAKNIKEAGISLVSFDDRGSGARKADINFGSMPFNYSYALSGKKVFSGLEYLVIDKRIDALRRLRREMRSVVVTLGGSDTYGITPKVVDILKKRNISAKVIVGPCFEHMAELKRVADERHEIIDNVDSLPEEFFKHDMAVTSGGITPLEANAAGLPCIIIANEPHEIDTGRMLEKLGSSLFAGYRDDVDSAVFEKKMDLESLSRAGLEGITTNGAENVYAEMSLL